MEETSPSLSIYLLDELSLGEDYDKIMLSVCAHMHLCVCTAGTTAYSFYCNYIAYYFLHN